MYKKGVINMSKKLVSAICASLMVISAGVCMVGYVLKDSGSWWLFIFGAGVICAIISMVGNFTREKDLVKKHQGLIGCICASISMISVFVFLVLLLKGFNNSWIIVCIGGIISFVVYTLDKAIVSEKKDQK